MAQANALVLEIERVERDAYGDLYEAAPAHVRAALGVETRAIGQTRLLLCPGVDNLQFNRLCGLGVFEPAQGAEIEEAVASFTRAGVKEWAIQFAEGAEGVEFAAPRAGLTPHRRTWAKFARDDAPAHVGRRCVRRDALPRAANGRDRRAVDRGRRVGVRGRLRRVTATTSQRSETDTCGCARRLYR